jgi:hypothetical protein
MSARPEPLNMVENALFISIMWLENIPEYEGRVFCLDVDMDSGRVTLYGDVGLTSEFNKKLECMLTEVQ